MSKLFDALSAHAPVPAANLTPSQFKEAIETTWDYVRKFPLGEGGYRSYQLLIAATYVDSITRARIQTQTERNAISAAVSTMVQRYELIVTPNLSHQTLLARIKMAPAILAAPATAELVVPFDWTAPIQD